MSRTVEQKVVEMRFDNSNFEKNVSQSMDSLNKLQNAIDKTSSGNAFAGLSKALDNVNFGSVTTAIQTVTEKFSLWEEIAIGAARNIGAALSNYVVKGLNDMVFKNVSAGWDKYATKTEAVQTIMASIADQDFGNVDKMEYVEGLMEKLNWFTDETSFHLTDMISSIGKFTSAGVNLDKASDAMMGIATWAAVSGANADTASRVMYQLSQSLGLGSVRTQDWMSVETANMATKEFKELAIQVAKTKGEIDKYGYAKGSAGSKTREKVSFQNFRETLKYGWLTSDVLTTTLSQYSGFANALNRVYTAFDEQGQFRTTSSLIPVLKEAKAKAKEAGITLEEYFEKTHDIKIDFSYKDEKGKIKNLADDITDLGIRAFAAAQEAKTFNEAIGSVGDAASTVWMNVFETIFGNYEQAKKLWTGLANDLYDLFVEPIYAVSDLIDKWADLGGRDILFGREEDENGVVTRIGAFDILLGTILDVNTALRDGFLETIGYSDDTLEDFTRNTLIKLSNKVLDIAKKFKKWVGNVEDLTEKFKNFFGFFKDIIDSIDIFNQKSEDSFNLIGLIKQRFEDTFGRVENVLQRVKSIIGYIKDGFVEFFKALKFNGTSIMNFGDTAENLGEIGNDLAKALSPITLIFKKMGEFGKKAGTLISNLVGALSSVPKEITSILRNTNLLSWGADALKRVLDAVHDGFSEAFDSAIFADIQEMFKYVWSAIKTFIDGFTSNFNVYDKIKTISKGVASAINLVGRAIQLLLTPIKVLDGMGVFTELGKFFVGPILNALLSIPATIAKIVLKLDEFIKQNPRVHNILEGIITIFSSIIRFVLSAANVFSDFIKKTKPLSKVGSWVKDLFDSFKESEVLTSIGSKVSESFDKVVKFFNEKFTIEAFIEKIKNAKVEIKEFVDGSQFLTNIKNWFDSITDSVKNFINESEFLSNFKTNLKELWENIKKLFGGEENFEGFGANFMSGFVKGLVDNAKIVFAALKEFAGKALQTLKDFFGIHSPSTETEEIGTNLIDGLVKGLVEGIKKIVAAIKKVAGSTIGALSSSLFGDGGNPEWASQGTESTKESIAASENIKKGLGAFAKSLLGIGAIALPTVAVGKISNLFRSLMSPFEALERALTIAEWKTKGEVIVKGITAIGGMLKTVLLSLGGFLLMVAAAGAILALADKYTNGNVLGTMAGMVGIIAEVLLIVSSLATTLVKMGAKSKVTGNLKTQKLDLIKNETASYMEAIGEIFIQIGAGMLLLAASIAALAYVSKEFGGDNVAAAFGMVTAFLGILSLGAYFIAKFSEGETKSGLKINKSGINLTHKGYTEGFYAIGAFMLEVSVAMTAMALAASIVIKASGGDINKMNAAFNGMTNMLAVAMGAMIAVVWITNTVPSKNIGKASSAIRDAGVALTAMALSIRIIAKTVIMLGKEDDAKVQKGLKVIYQITPIVLAFGAIATLAKPSMINSAKGLSGLLLGIAASFAIIGVVIKQLGKMDPAQLNQGLKAFATFAMFFGVISSISLLAANVSKDGGKFGLMGFMLMEIAASLVIVAAAIKILDGIGNMGKSITGLLSSFLALAAMLSIVAVISSADKVDSGEISAMAGSLLLMSGSFVIMAKAMQMMGETTDMSQAIGGLIATFAALGLLFAIVAGMSVLNEGKGSEILKSAAGLALVAASMAVLMKIVADVGTTFAQNDGSLGKGVLALAAVLTVLAGVAVVAKFAAPAMLAFGMGIAALGVGILALAAGFFVFYQTLVLLSAEAALFGGAVGDMVEGFLDRFIALGPKITDSISMIFKAIANGIADSAIEIVKAIVKVVKAIGDNIDEILAILAPIMDKLINWLVDRIDYLIVLIEPLVDSFVAHGIWLLETMLLPAVLRCVQTIIDFISTNIPALADMLVTTVESVVTRLLTLVNYLINSEAGILAIIGRALMGENGILTILNTFLRLLLESLRNLTTDLIDTIVYIIQELVNGIIDNIDIILTGIEDTINIIVDHIVSLTDTILGGIVEVIEGIASAIENHGSNIWKAIWHVAKAIWNSFWGIFSGDGENSISNLASNIMEGLGNGIKNFVGKVTGAISSIADTVIGKFKSVFGINSPSKVTAMIGEFLDQGLANGIVDSSNLPINSVSGLGNGIIDSLKSTFLGDNVSDITGLFGDNLSNGLSDALGGISDSLSTDDFTPTITPVLDLSEIQNGASMIPGMIGSGSGYTVDTTAVVRSAYNPYQYYDGTEKISSSDAQLSYFEALKAKMDEVVNKFGNAKVVLDTGAVVGGIVDPMDMALGQRMVQVGRGVISSTR